MRFGICSDLNLIKDVEDLGFDYIEAKLNLLTPLSDDEFCKILSLVASSKIKVEAASLLFPKTMMLIKSDGDDELRTYLDLAFSRLNALGCKIAVFGSGKSRCVPPLMRWQDAYNILVEKTKIIGEKATEYDVQVAIEPLNRKETNLINSLAEGAALSCSVNMASVGLLADMYHMAEEEEDMSRIELMSPLVHTHVALKGSRAYPEVETEELLSFFRHLKNASYDGRMSIEGKSEDWKKSSISSLELLRKLDRE